MTKQLGREGDENIDINEIQEQIYVDHTAIQISDDYLFEMTTPESEQIVSDDEDTEPVEEKFTLDNIAEGIRRVEILRTFFMISTRQ